VLANPQVLQQVGVALGDRAESVYLAPTGTALIALNMHQGTGALDVMELNLTQRNSRQQASNSGLRHLEFKTSASLGVCACADCWHYTFRQRQLWHRSGLQLSG
jgi:hypothetical protein